MQYSIIKKKSMICAYSEERLNFEPKDWRKDFKKELSNVIKELAPVGEIFKSKLITEVNEFFDVENILFYNLGTSNFKRLDTKGVWFSLERGETLHNKKYVYEYGFADSFPEIKEDIIAEWSNVKIEKPTVGRKPLDYWMSFNQSNRIKTNCVNYQGEFGLSIIIDKPKNEVLNVINIQKPLLDGIISVFHEATKVDDNIIEYISSKAYCSIEEIESFFGNNKIAVLPKRNIIRKYGEGIKWNPQDEKCIEVRILVRDTEDKLYKLSGYMFKKEKVFNR